MRKPPKELATLALALAPRAVTVVDLRDKLLRVEEGDGWVREGVPEPGVLVLVALDCPDRLRNYETAIHDGRSWSCQGSVHAWREIPALAQDQGHSATFSIPTSVYRSLTALSTNLFADGPADAQRTLVMVLPEELVKRLESPIAFPVMPTRH